MLVVEFDAGQHLLQLGNGAHDVRAFHGVLLHQLEFLSGEGARLFQDAVVHADFADIVQERGDAQFVEVLFGKSKLARNQCGIFCDAAGVASSVRILFVDCGRQHADGAEEKLPIGFGGLLQLFDVLLDVAGHLVEVFGELADFGGAANGGPLVEFTAADGAGGCGQSADGLADTDSEEIADANGCDDDEADECQSLAVELGDTRVGAGFGKTTLRNDRPIHFRESAVGPDHFHGVFIFGFREVHVFGVAKFLRKCFDARDDSGKGADIFAGRESAGIGMGDDVALMIDHEDAAAADTGVFQAVKNGIQRDDSGDHARELVVHVQWHGDHEGRLVVRLEGQRVAAEFNRTELRRLHASDEGALQGLADERILFRAEITL